MPLTTSNDISVVLSGGSTNLNPNLSLGGNPSSAPISNGTLNNLFDDVSPDEAFEGMEDYRCIYIFNDGDTTIYNLKIHLQEEVEGGGSIELGVEQEDEFQRLTISGDTVTGGSMTLIYDEIEFVSNYNSDLSEWAGELQTTLNSLLDDNDNPVLSDVSVTAQAAGSSIIFDIQFLGQDGSENHPIITVSSNDLTPSVTITIIAIQEGGPINTVAPAIGVETVPPGGVVFSVPTEDSPFQFEKLNPTEGFPIWIKRIVEAESSAVANDGVTIHLFAESLLPDE